MYKTSNRGGIWTKLTGSQFDRVNSLTFNPNNLNEAYLTTEIQGLWVSKNMNLATPTWSLVTAYPFRQPERVYFNPYNKNELWISSFGNGMKVGLQSAPNSISENVTANQSISSYPNPFNDKLHLSNQNNIPISQANIYNGQGQLLISEKQPKDYINTDQLQSGVYILEIVRDGELREFEKIVK